MLDKKVTELINVQINKEFYSAYLYLNFANFYKSKGLDGFSNWYMVQAQEEKDHAMLYLKYLQNNNEEVILDVVEKPAISMEKLIDPLKAGLAHEEYVTDLINTIYDAAQNVKDFRTMQFLDWFIKEQGEEETNSHELITKMELFGTDPKGLYMLDNELKGRVYTPPSLII